MRRGVRLGVDVGSVRVGVARSDPEGVLAVPLETVAAGDLGRIVALAAECDAIEIVVGLPIGLSGREGPAARAARRFARLLAARLGGTPVRLVDERLSTATAEQALRARGVDGRGRRRMVDQAAATIILQAALDAERLTGRPPGEMVPEGQ